MIEQTTYAGAVVLAVLGGFFCLAGIGMLLFLPRTLQGRGAVGGATLGIGVLLLIVLVTELLGSGAPA